MKNTINFPLIIITTCVFLLCQSCGEMLSAMSTVNEANGSQCATYTSVTYAYYEGKWLEGRCFETDDDSDCDWIEKKRELYMGYGTFNTYYHISPYTNIEYKITIYCLTYY